MNVKPIQDKLHLRIARFGIAYSFMLVVFGCGRPSEEKRDNGENRASIQASISRYEKFNVYQFDPKSMEMGVALRKPRKADFYLNSNFFSTKPIGLVVIDGKRSHARVKGGGYFYVVDGVPNIKAKACPKMTNYASQTILWGIDDGEINAKLIEEKHAKLKEFRSIFGTKKDGQFLLVASNNGSRVSIEELVYFARDLGMNEGVLFDGGSSLDYKLTTSTETEVCQPVPSLVKKIAHIHEPMVYIYGNLKRLR